MNNSDYQIFEYENPWNSRLKRRELTGCYDDFSESVILPSIQSWETSVLGHELSHHCLRVTTPYGAFLTFLDSLRTNFLKAFFNEALMDNACQPVFVPLVDWFKELKKNQMIKSETEDKFFLWHCLTKLRHAFEGSQNYSADVINHSLDRIRRNEVTKDAFPENFSFSPNVFDNLDTVQYGNSACPICFDEPLGGLHLLESIAWIMEIAEKGKRAEALRKYNSTDLSGKTAKYAGPYHNAFILYMNKLFPWFNEVEHLLDEPFLFFNSAIGFIASVHLSLLSPIHSIFRPLCSSSTTWVDLHPGWRFIRICEVIKESAFIKDLNISYNLSDYESFQNKICKKLNLPQPKQFRKLAKKKLHRMKGLEYQNPEILRTCKALLACEKWPWAYVFSITKSPFEVPINLPPRKLYNLVTTEFGPAIIHADISIIRGWRTDDGNPEYKQFKEVLKQSRKLKHHSVIPSQELSDNFFAAVYTEVFYLLGAWIDYIMVNDFETFDIFFSETFPFNDNWKPMEEHLIADLDLGLVLNFGCSLQNFRRKKTRQPLLRSEDHIIFHF